MTSRSLTPARKLAAQEEGRRSCCKPSGALDGPPLHTFPTLQPRRKTRLLSFKWTLSPVEVFMPGRVLHIQNPSFHIPEVVEIFIEGLLNLQQASGHLRALLTEETRQWGLFAIFPAGKVLLAIADLSGEWKRPQSPSSFGSTLLDTDSVGPTPAQRMTGKEAGAETPVHPAGDPSIQPIQPALRKTGRQRCKRA